MGYVSSSSRQQVILCAAARLSSSSPIACQLAVALHVREAASVNAQETGQKAKARTERACQRHAEAVAPPRAARPGAAQITQGTAQRVYAAGGQAEA